MDDANCQMFIWFEMHPIFWLCGCYAASPPFEEVGPAHVFLRRHPAAPPFLIPEKWPAPLQRRRLALLERRSFLVDTILSGTGIFRLMEAVRKEGCKIVLHYVSLGSPERALDASATE